GLPQTLSYGRGPVQLFHALWSLLSPCYFPREPVDPYQFLNLELDGLAPGGHDVLFSPNTQEYVRIHRLMIAGQLVSNGGQIGLLENGSKVELGDSQADDRAGIFRRETCASMDDQRNRYFGLNSSQRLEIDGSLALSQHMNIANGHREGVNPGLFNKGPRRGRIGDLSVAIRTVPPIRQMPNLTLDKNIPGVG